MKEVIRMEQYEQLDELMNQPDTVDKLQTLEEWIGEADEKKNIGWQYDLRMSQTEVAMNVARYDLVMDNFSWCLDIYEQNKEAIYVEPLLWQFKWFLEKIDIFPRVSLEEVNDFYEYFFKLLNENQYTLRSYYQLRAYQAYKAGDRKKLEEYRDLWLKEEKDNISDCEYCEKCQLMTFSFELGELKKGFELADELLDGSFQCENVPHAIYPQLLIPAYNSGKKQEATMWQEQGYFLIRKNPKYLLEIGLMIFYLSLTDIKKAYDLFNDHVDMADDQIDLNSRFYFYLASWCMMERAKKMRYHLKEDINWFIENVPLIASEFDKRNGNQHFKETMEEWLSYVDDEE